MKKLKGFTLIELLIVIAIIAIIAAVVFVALNPLKRFQDSRDSRRATDANAILSAIKVHQVDNAGAYLSSINSATAGTVYMIGGSSCNTSAICDTPATACIDLSGLVTAGYIGSIPVSPNGASTWTASTTGYTLSKASTGIITIRSCESENTTEISVTR